MLYENFPTVYLVISSRRVYCRLRWIFFFFFQEEKSQVYFGKDGNLTNVRKFKLEIRVEALSCVW